MCQLSNPNDWISVYSEKCFKKSVNFCTRIIISTKIGQNKHLMLAQVAEIKIFKACVLHTLLQVSETNL